MNAGHAIGFCSRTGSAAAVAVEVAGGTASLAGRWAVDLTDQDTPWQLFHAAAELPGPQAEELVRAGVAAVTRVATARLRELRSGLAVAAVGVVTGDHPVPDSVAAILASHPLMHAAEGQLYRDALLDAAVAALAAVRFPGAGP